MEIKARNIRIVAGQHGNEKAPVRALASLGVEFELGNPLAYERNIRFVDQDLNASFGLAGDSYESRRVQELLQLIPPEDVVVDFHTTSAITPPFVILTDVGMLPLAERTGLQHAVLMTHNIKKGYALINVRDGISVEMSGYDSEESFQTTVEVIRHLESGKSRPVTLYEVYGLITEPGQYVNLVEHVGGFFPVLVGEESYGFIGLKARRLQ